VSAQDYQGRKVLVTGASGFIGTHLCRRLHELGAEVHAVSRSRHDRERKELHWWQGDITDTDWVTRTVRAVRPGLIFHLASRVEGSRDAALVLPTFRSNLMSTVNILLAARELGCRAVLTGSLEEPAAGDSQEIPCSPYAAAKWASGGYARMFHALYQLSVITLRVFMVYGPGQQDLRKLVPYVTLSLLRGEPPRLSSGKRPVDWIYVGDVVEGFIAAGLVAVPSGTFDIGSGELVSIRAVVERLVQLVNSSIQPLFGALPDRQLEQVRVADIGHSKELMQWQPATSLQSGLEKTVAWYAEELRAGTLAKT
jgi:nucleoside-diphosphate-sugar epimerase